MPTKIPPPKKKKKNHKFQTVKVIDLGVIRYTCGFPNIVVFQCDSFYAYDTFPVYSNSFTKL